MKLLLLFALIGICSATLYLPGRRQVYFGGENRAFIHGLYGKQYTLQQYPGRRFLDIVINGIGTPAKKIRIDGETCEIVNLEGFSRFDETYYNKYNLPNTYRFNYLFNILKNYQGYVDEYQYRTLLKDIKDEIQNGRICHIIYQLLTCLDDIVNEDLIETYQKTEQIRQIYLTGEDYFGGDWTQKNLPGYGSQYGYPWYTYGKTYGYPWTYLTNLPRHGYQSGYPGYTYGGTYGYPWTYLTTEREPIFGGLKTALKDYLRGGLYDSDRWETYKPQEYYRYGPGLRFYEYEY